MEPSYLLNSQKTEVQGCLPNTSKNKKIMESTAGGSLDSNPFDSLPTEILQRILGYLPVYDRVRVERVCKRWKNVSNEQVWRDVQVLHIVRQDHQTKYRRFQESLKKFGKFITMENNKLSIRINELGIIKSLVSKAGQNIKKIIFVVDSDQTPTKSVLSIIAAHCHNIECIELDEVEKSAVRVFSRLLRDNEQLRSITYTDADYIIKKLPLRDWKSLDLEFYRENKGNNWDNRLIAIIKNSPSLEKLCTSHWTMNMMAVISKCEQLKSLDFCQWEAYDKVMIPSLLNRLTCLRLLFIHHEIDSKIAFLRSCINLESLSFYYYSDEPPLEVLQAVVALPKLKFLEISASSITPETLSCFFKVKCLKLKNSPHFHTTITEDWIPKIVMNSDCLEKLDIADIYVTTEFFEKLVQNAGKRRKALEIEVRTEIYEKALNICEGSKIHII